MMRGRGLALPLFMVLVFLVPCCLAASGLPWAGVDANGDGLADATELATAQAQLVSAEYSQGYSLTWKVIGIFGASMFGLRWLVQAWATRKAGKPTIPLVFWVMSVLGASMTLAYFVFYKNDSVGILQNALPAAVAAYNLYLALRHRPVPGEEGRLAQAAAVKAEPRG